MNEKHTPEPWAVYDGQEIHGVLDSTGRHLAEMWQRKDYDSLANARRIVACVNACADMADPEAEIEQLKKDKQTFCDALKKIINANLLGEYISPSEKTEIAINALIEGGEL